MLLFVLVLYLAHFSSSITQKDKVICLNVGAVVVAAVGGAVVV